jgi:hypothetical protein
MMKSILLWAFVVSVFFALIGAVSILRPESLSQPYGGQINCEDAYGDFDLYGYNYPAFWCSIKLTQVPEPRTGTYESEPHQNESVVKSFLAGIGAWIERVFNDPVSGFTGILTVSTLLLWRETKRIARVSERALTDLERAHIFIFVEISADAATAPTFDEQGNILDFPLEIRVHNYGRSPAILWRTGFFTEVTSVLPLVLPDAPTVTVPNGCVIGSDKSEVLVEGCQISATEWGDVLNGAKKLYCYGFIDYSDTLGNAWSTGYCWEFSMRNNNAGCSICPGTPLNYRT